MIVVLNIKKPYQVVFTENISINYNLGIQVIRKTLLVQKVNLFLQIVKLIYSFLCFFLRLKTIAK
jgi:hypothetical protein